MSAEEKAREREKATYEAQQLANALRTLVNDIKCNGSPIEVVSWRKKIEDRYNTTTFQQNEEFWCLVSWDYFAKQSSRIEHGCISPEDRKCMRQFMSDMCDCLCICFKRFWEREMSFLLTIIEMIVGMVKTRTVCFNPPQDFRETCIKILQQPIANWCLTTLTLKLDVLTYYFYAPHALRRKDRLPILTALVDDLTRDADWLDGGKECSSGDENAVRLACVEVACGLMRELLKEHDTDKEELAAWICRETMRSSCHGKEYSSMDIISMKANSDEIKEHMRTEETEQGTMYMTLLYGDACNFEKVHPYSEIAARIVEQCCKMQKALLRTPANCLTRYVDGLLERAKMDRKYANLSALDCGSLSVAVPAATAVPTEAKPKRQRLNKCTARLASAELACDDGD